MFLAYLLATGGVSYFAADITQPAYNYSSGTYNSTYSNVSVSAGDYVGYLWNQPFSAFGYLVWFSIALLITNIYIIVTSLIP